MIKLSSIITAGLLIVLSVLLFHCSSSKGEEEPVSSGLPSKPNIIYILADDLGYGDLSCYGQTILSTPRLDQLAQEGIRLDNHYTGSTVCAPSRACLLTGQHTGHTSVRGNHPDQLLKGKDTTVAELLKDAGYVTGIVGKWGVGHPPPPNDPQRNGFDFAYGYINMWHAHNFYPEFLYRNGKKENLKGNQLMMIEGENPWADKPEGTGVAEQKNTYTHDLFEKEAIRFIENHQDTSFFLYVAFNIPHANNEHPNNGMEVPSYGEFADQNWPEPEKGFASMIRRLDNSVGNIVDKIDELGLAETTLIIFTSDNGPHEEGFHEMEFFDSNGDLKGMKRDLYGGGVKTPFIARWMGHIKPNSRSNHLSAFWDFLPTASEVADIAPPEYIDGISYLPTLLGKDDQQPKHDYLYWEFYGLGGKQAVLKDYWKAVRHDLRKDRPSPTELYNIYDDPGELVNIAAQHPGLIVEMERYMQEAHTPFPTISLYGNKAKINTHIDAVN